MKACKIWCIMCCLLVTEWFGWISDWFKALTFVRLISWLIKKWVAFRCALVFWVLFFYGGGGGGRRDVLRTNHEPTNVQLLEDVWEFQVLIQAFSHDVLCFRASLWVWTGTTTWSSLASCRAVWLINRVRKGQRETLQQQNLQRKLF